MPTLTGGMTLAGTGMVFSPPPPPPAYTALENISAGDPVSIIGDDVRISKSVSSSATNTTLTTSGSATSCLYQHPGSGKLILLHGSSNTIVYYVGTPSGSGVSWSSASTLFTESGGNNTTVYSLRTSEWNGNDTMLVLSYSGNYRMALITFNSSTDTLTMATDFTISGSKTPTSMVYDSTYDVWVYVKGLNSQSDVGVYLTNSTGTSQTTALNLLRSMYHCIFRSPNGGYIITGGNRREDGGGAQTGDVRSTLISIDSATTASQIDFVTYPVYRSGADVNISNPYEIDMTFDSSGNALSAWSLQTNNYTTADNRSVQGNFLTVTSTSISAGSTFTAVPNTSGSSSGNGSLMGAYYSDNKYWVYFKNPWDNKFTVTTFTNSSGSPSGKTTTNTGITAASVNTNNLGCILFETSAGSAVWSTSYVDNRKVASEYFPAKDYRTSLSGIAKTTVTSGQDLEVFIQGQTATSVSGLDGSSVYYVSTTGTLTTSNTGYQVGTSTGATTLNVNIV